MVVDKVTVPLGTLSKRATGVVDNGIGAYEFWGQRGFHSDVGVVSDCCEKALVYNDSSRTPVDASVLHEIERGDRDDH